MGKIHILPDRISSKIAAGEVIERPASVVKELIENSLDAHSRKISVSLLGGGKNLIQIRDDGEGIEKDDIRFLFQRHSTSKIKEFDDLFRISSMGFRGEALYSISAVSDVILRSRTKDDETGWEIRVINGNKTEPKPVPMRYGTEIEVHNLFSHFPARRKFLKSDNLEFRKILDCFIPYAISHPEISFSLIHNRKVILDLQCDVSRKSRISRIFNIPEKNLIEINWKALDNSISIEAISGDINIQRPRKDIQFIFVNTRPVQHNGISFTINNIYRSFMPPETYPAFAIFLDIKRENVDINVHPTKREVKIKNEAEVLDIVRTIIEEKLSSKIQPRVISYNEDMKPRGSHISEKSFEYQTSSAQELDFEFTSKQQPEAEDFRNAFLQSRFIATVLSTYLLFESGNRLFFVDQHAAHERITFEKLLRQANQGKIETQQLLIPVSVYLTTQEMIVWNSGGKVKLEEIGFQTTQWDDRTIAIHSCPDGIGNPELAVKNILSQGQCNFNIEDLLKKACRGSTMAGQILSEQEAHSLKVQLLSCSQPLVCPHGRPTIIEIEKNFIERQFLR